MGLENYLNEILQKLRDAERALASDAERNSLLAAIGKVVLILLGAFVTTKEVASQLFGASNVWNIVIYTLVGLAISVIAGLDAAFKWTQSSSDLKSLAATCQIARQDCESGLEKALAIKDDDAKQAALENIVDSMTKNLDDIYTKAATFGINIALEIAGLSEKPAISGASKDPSK